MTDKERKTYDQVTTEYRKIRRKLWEQKGHICAGCGAPATQLHHIVPRHMGGQNNSTNIVQLCGTCHAKAHEKRGTFKNGKADLEAYRKEKARVEMQSFIEETQAFIEETNRNIELQRQIIEETERQLKNSKIQTFINASVLSRRIKYYKEEL